MFTVKKHLNYIKENKKTIGNNHTNTPKRSVNSAMTTENQANKTKQQKKNSTYICRRFKRRAVLAVNEVSK